MESGRVQGILQAVQDRREASTSREERDTLVSRGLLTSVDSAMRDRWTAAVAGLPALRDRVREMSRVALATPGPTAPPELRIGVSELEELTREKGNLDLLVWNGPTQEFLLPTLVGRGVLGDLTTWQKRLGGRTFEDFSSELETYRLGLLQTINRANSLLRSLLADETGREELETPSYDVPFTTVDFRFASMILGKRPIDPYLLVRGFQFFHHDMSWGSRNKDDVLIGSAILASLPWDPTTVRSAFERLRIQLESHGILPEDRILVAASLADLHESWWDSVLGRIDDIHRQRPALNSLLASALARSPYSVPDALGRFDEALSGMATRGYRDGIHIEAAAALLAAAQIPRGAMVERFAIAVSHLAGTFDPPYAPSAMIAASPLEPVEAVDVFRDCIGAITRTSFFDLTLEIEELALIMSYGVAPLGLGYLAANLAPGAPVVPTLPAPEMVSLYGPSWYVWHNYLVYRPIGRYIATHPVHVHTVAGFG